MWNCTILVDTTMPLIPLILNARHLISVDFWTCTPKAERTSIQIPQSLLCRNFEDWNESALHVKRCGSEGARYGDVNEVMHMRGGGGGAEGLYEWWMLLYKMHSIANGSRLSGVLFLSEPTMIEGAGCHLWVGVDETQNRSGSPAFSNALHEAFWLPVPVEFLCWSFLPSVHWIACVSSTSSCPEPEPYD